jgi:nucleoside 2-deoxyribosyltransferase
LSVFLFYFTYAIGFLKNLYLAGISIDNESSDFYFKLCLHGFVASNVITKEKSVEKRPYKIYCAGPLFNPIEKEEMAQIASALENAGYSVFLPQRDGLEFAELFPFFVEKGFPAQSAQKILNMAIFSLDVFQIVNSEGLLLNMNGRVPDEGAMVEAGIAWAHNKVVVIFKNDSRSLIQGNCNPLVLGLADFSFIDCYDQIAGAFEAKISTAVSNLLQAKEPVFQDTTKRGKEISDYLTARKSFKDIADLLINLFGGKTWDISEDPRKNYSQANMQP